MNLYYVGVNVTRKTKNEPDVVEIVDFAMPAYTPEEALEKSKIHGPDGILRSRVELLGRDWR